MDEPKITLYQGDCLEVMDRLMEQGVKVDAVITDPPYLINYKTNYRKDKEHRFCKEILNDDEFDFIVWAEKVNRLLKQNGVLYVFGSWKTEPYFRDIFCSFWKHKNNIIWVKNNWTAGDLKSQYGQQYEIIMYYVKGDTFFRKKRYSDVWNIKRISGDKQLHQNEKPVNLINMIINNTTNKNDIVLDCFMGSGTTGVACVNLNRNFIGIELDEGYFNIAKKRIETAQKNKQEELF